MVNKGDFNQDASNRRYACRLYHHCHKGSDLNFIKMIADRQETCLETLNKDTKQGT